MVSTLVKHPTIFASLLGMTLPLSACGGQSQADIEPIQIDGSSTVYPITVAVAQAYQQQSPEAQVTVNFSGTGGGFEKFCAGETQINDASRPILRQEMAACKQAGVPYIELPIAFDALTVVVHPQNDWVDYLSIAELQTIWEPAAQGKITRWNQVRPNWPNQPLNLFGPGTDSGTYDYFVEAIGVDASRSDYTASEDDDVIAQGVIQDPNALGYFGFAYYEENQDQLQAVTIEGSKGLARPTQEAVVGAIYQPLSRPLFIYVNAVAAQSNPALEDFVEFYLEQAPAIVATVGYIPLPDEGYHIAEITLQQGEVGTVFEGKPELDLTIAEVLRRRAEY